MIGIYEWGWRNHPYLDLDVVERSNVNGVV